MRRGAFLDTRLKIPYTYPFPVTVQSLGSGERGERIAAVVGGNQLGQELEQGAALLSAGRGCGQGGFGEPLAVIGAGVVRELSVDDEEPWRGRGCLGDEAVMWRRSRTPACWHEPPAAQAAVAGPPVKKL